MILKGLVLFTVVLLGSSSILQADEGDDLIKKLQSAAPDYLSKQIKGDSDLSLIKDQALRNSVVNFCKNNCAEVSKPVPMGAAGHIVQTSCSNPQCPRLCPETSVPDVCKN